jgi:hypothetical protein
VSISRIEGEERERLGVTSFLRLIDGPVTLLLGMRETSIIGKGALVIERHRHLER